MPESYKKDHLLSVQIFRGFPNFLTPTQHLIQQKCRLILSLLVLPATVLLIVLRSMTSSTMISFSPSMFKLFVSPQLHNKWSQIIVDPIFFSRGYVCERPGYRSVLLQCCWNPWSSFSTLERRYGQ